MLSKRRQERMVDRITATELAVGLGENVGIADVAKGVAILPCVDLNPERSPVNIGEVENPNVRRHRVKHIPGEFVGAGGEVHHPDDPSEGTNHGGSSKSMGGGETPLWSTVEREIMEREASEMELDLRMRGFP